MSLDASRVTSVWAYTLAELQPVPQDKLAVLLLRTAEGPVSKDAGTILQRVLPLTMFLEKAHDKVWLLGYSLCLLLVTPVLIVVIGADTTMPWKKVAASVSEGSSTCPC